MSASYTILYITSPSHSGSTLLDLLLSSHGRVSGIGEIKVISRKVRDQRRKRLPDRRDPLENKCACGIRPILACPFWQQVETVLGETHSLHLADLDLMHENPEQFERHNHALFSAVQAVTGSSHLVDLSKDLTRLRRLMDAGSFHVRPILIVRNPCGVVYSHMKKERGWFAHACKYRATMQRTRDTLANTEHLRVSYEQLAGAPRDTLMNIMEWVGLPFEERQLEWASCEHHHLAGNRLRRLRSDEIRVDDAWRSDLGLVQKLGISLVTWPAGFNKGSP